MIRVTAERTPKCCDTGMNHPDRAIERTAQRQHGFVSRAQCLDAGLSKTQIHTRLANRRWIRYLPGVFLLPGVKVTNEGRLMAAQLWAGKNSLLSHSSAAWLHRIDETPPTRPELYVQSGKKCPGVRCYRWDPGESLGVARRNGLAFTKVERTLLDISRRSDPRRVGRSMDSSLRQGLTTLDRLNAEAIQQARQGRLGCKVFRELLRGRDHRDAAVRSEFETRTLRTLKRIRTAHVIPNHHVVTTGSSFYLDFAFPQVKLGIECQSVKWHLGDEALKRDSARFRKLALAGWVILPFCWDDVVFNSAGMRREVEEALGLRSHRSFY